MHTNRVHLSEIRALFLQSQGRGDLFPPLIARLNLQLALSIISKERGLCKPKQFCCFFPKYDSRFLTIDTDLSMKHKQDIRLHHEIQSPMTALIRKCGSSFFPLFQFLQKS